MTANVKQVLQKIYNNEIFNDELYFTGGTALAYYLNHRISEDIDIVSSSKLNHIEISSQMTALGAIKIKDEHETALRMAGLFPDEYMIKFVLDDVKVEFFQANRAIQKEILALFSKVDDKFNSLESIINFIRGKIEPYDDEAVYLNETKRVDLSFEVIQNKVIGLLSKLKN